MSFWAAINIFWEQQREVLKEAAAVDNGQEEI